MSLSRTAYFANGFAVGGMMDEARTEKKIAKLYAAISYVKRDRTKIKNKLSAAIKHCEQLKRRNAELESENDRLRSALSVAWDFRCEWHDCRRWTHKVNDDFCYFHKAIFETYGINKAAIKEVDGVGYRP